MAKNNYKPSFEECSKAYWTCIERYEEVRRDEYSTWKQLQSAADDVATARNVWFRRVEQSHGINHDKKERRADAAQSIASETGEPVEWLIERAGRR